MRSMWWRFCFLWPALIYVLLLGVLVAFKDGMVYPGVSMYAHLKADHVVFQQAVEKTRSTLWETGDGKYLGLKREVDDPQCRWIILYGNGDVSLRATGWFDFLQSLHPERPMSFYVLEYPGYGPQSGKTSEAAIVELAALARAQLPDDAVPLFLLGQSMGSGVSCRLMAEQEWNQPGRAPKGLLLLNPYTSLVDAGRQFVRRLTGPLHLLFPVSTILGERYDSEANIQNYNGKVAIVAGNEDQLTPSWMAERLFELSSEPKKMWIQTATGHWVDTGETSKWRSLLDFLYE